MSVVIADIIWLAHHYRCFFASVLVIDITLAPRHLSCYQDGSLCKASVSAMGISS